MSSINSRLVFFFAVGFHVLTCCFGQELLVKEASIRNVGGGLEASFDLGTLEAGSKFKANLILLNESQYAIPIQRMTTSCSCIAVVSKENEIPPDGSAILEFALDVPSDVTNAEVLTFFSIHYTDENEIRVDVSYKLAGLATFKNAVMYHTKVPWAAKEHKFRIPILVTDPLKLDELKVVSSEGLMGLRFTPKAEGLDQWLECIATLDPKKVETKLGLITLKNPKNDRESSIRVVIEATSGLDVMPQSLRFLKSSEDSDLYEVNGIVRVDKTILRMNKAGDKEIPVTLNWKLGSSELKSTVERVGMGIYRFKLLANRNHLKSGAKAEQEADPTLTVEVNTGKDVIHKELMYRFE